MNKTRTNKASQTNASSSNASDVSPAVCDIVKNRTAHCRNSVLACQIQKALPDIATNIIDKRGSLNSVLRRISQESLTKVELDDRKKVVFQIPTKSKEAEVAVEEFVIAGDKERLLTEEFVRNLTTSIHDKRQYRENILSLKKKHWYSTYLYQQLAAERYRNFKSYFDFWHDALRTIEGNHGACIVSYFVFIRWLLYMNMIIFLLNFFFLLLPKLMFSTDDKFTINLTAIYSSRKSNKTKKEKNLHEALMTSDYHVHSTTNITSIDILNKHCQELYYRQLSNNTQSGFIAAVQHILQGTGPFETSHLFLGHYPPYVITVHGGIYYLSLASLCILFITFFICFAMMIQYSSIGIQEAFLARSKQSYYISNEVFSAWDYCIDSLNCADCQHYSFFLSMKTNLYDATLQVDSRSSEAWLKLYGIRFAINLLIIIWLISCYYLIYAVTVYQMKEMQFHLSDTGLSILYIQFLPALTVITLNTISPAFFSVVISFEKYDRQTELNISLFRNVFLYLSGTMVLLNTFYQQTACKPKDHCGAGFNQSCNSPKCWESYIGQQLFKLTIMDFFVYIGIFLGFDLPWDYSTRHFNNKLTRLLGPQEFFLPTEVQYPVYSQTIIWLGVFYSPLLPGLMVLKLIMIFYLKKYKVLKFCEPSTYSFRTSRFNAVFIMILLISFFTVIIGHSFALERIPPSHGCGPFRQLDSMTEAVPDNMRTVLSVLLSHWTSFILTVLLCFAINYYWGVITLKKELTKRLQHQLVLQSCDKQFLLKKIADLTQGKTTPRHSKIS